MIDVHTEQSVNKGESLALGSWPEFFTLAEENAGGGKQTAQTVALGSDGANIMGESFSAAEQIPRVLFPPRHAKKPLACRGPRYSRAEDSARSLTDHSG